MSDGAVDGAADATGDRQRARLLADAASAAWQTRIAAGRALTAHAEHPAAARTLAILLLDSADTAVTRWTAVALLTRGDPAAVRLLAAALAASDDNHADWLLIAVQDFTADAMTGNITPHPITRAAASCLAVAADPTVPLTTREAATELSEALRNGA